ncbi:MAG: hypothetical protein GX606_02375 [Elusimicrobia bacterium]|nr:hypothetical protein [Elusimicrobiota bacterium]
MTLHPSRRFYPVLAGLSVLGAILFFVFFSSRAPGVDQEGAVYLQAARHLALGQGLAIFSLSGDLQPFLGFRPLWPVLLSGSWFLAVDVLVWVRLLQALLLGGNVFLFGLLMRRAVSSDLLGLLAAVAFFFLPASLNAHFYAGPGPLFLFLLLSIVSLMTGEEERPYFSGLLLGLAGATLRIPGWGALLFLSLWFGRELLSRQRGRDLAFFLLFSWPLALILEVRDRLLSQGPWSVPSVAEGTEVLFLSSVLMIAGCVILFDRAPKAGRAVRVSGTVLLCVVLLAGAGKAYLLSRRGAGFRSDLWEKSSVVKDLRSLEERVRVYSDDVRAAAYLTGRPAEDLDFSLRTKGAPVIAQDLKGRQGVVVLFKKGRPGAPSSGEQLKACCGLELVLEDEIASVYMDTKQGRSLPEAAF